MIDTTERKNSVELAREANETLMEHLVEMDRAFRQMVVVVPRRGEEFLPGGASFQGNRTPLAPCGNRFISPIEEWMGRDTRGR